MGRLASNLLVDEISIGMVFFLGVGLSTAMNPPDSIVRVKRMCDFEGFSLRTSQRKKISITFRPPSFKDFSAVVMSDFR